MENNLVTVEYIDDYIDDIKYRVLSGRLPYEDMRIVKRYKEYKSKNRGFKKVDFKKLISELNDWCVSVESENEIDCDFMGLITDQKGYFEGFPSDRIYEIYSKTNNKKFSVVLDNKYQVYTFMYLLRNCVMTL